jgi:hypothetical protein
MRDLMISVVRDYGWAPLRVYGNSIARCNMTADRVLIYDNISTEAYDAFAARGFQLVHVPMTNSFPRFIFRARQEAALKWLTDKVQNYRFILWSGLRDHIFQSDPFAWIENYLGADTDRLIGAGEGWQMKNVPCETEWNRNTCPQSSWAHLAEREALCSDTIAGDARLVHQVLKTVADMVVNNERAVDQAASNYALYCLHQDKLRIPALAEGYCATWFPEKAMDPAKLIGYDNFGRLTLGAPVFNVRDGLVYTPDGKTPYTMVHQYDRCPVWKDLMEIKYA